MALLIASTTTPVGTLNLIADGELLLGANLSSIRALKDGLDSIYRGSEFKEVSKIPVISDLISDYFDGDLNAINGIKVSQPGGSFSQAAWKAMRKVAPGKTWSYADLAAKTGSPSASRLHLSAREDDESCSRSQGLKSAATSGHCSASASTREWCLSGRRAQVCRT